MIISRTPLRISFAGGGSDLPAFYQRMPGAVVSTAINKYIYLVVQRKFDQKIRASYSITEIVDDVHELKHELIREALQKLEQTHSIEITSISDIPSQGTGLGSSSTYTVGLLNSLYAYTGQWADAERLAKEACEIEIERCRKPIGKQDQYIAAYGGFQYIQFNMDGSVFVDPIICSPNTKKRLQERLLMFYTGLTRSADDVLKNQKINIETDSVRQQTLQTMTKMAQHLREALSQDDIDTFGEILHEGWKMKRSLATGITNECIDHWYACALSHGAIGGKLLGAGGGGFLLVYAPVERHEEIKAALKDLHHMPFSFEPQGSKIVYVEEYDSLM